MAKLHRPKRWADEAQGSGGVYHVCLLTQPSPGEHHLHSVPQGHNLLLVPVEVSLQVALWDKIEHFGMTDFSSQGWSAARLTCGLATFANLETHCFRQFSVEASMFSSVAKTFPARDEVMLLALVLTYCLRGVYTSQHNTSLWMELCCCFNTTLLHIHFKWIWSYYGHFAALTWVPCRFLEPLKSCALLEGPFLLSFAESAPARWRTCKPNGLWWVSLDHDLAS